MSHDRGPDPSVPDAGEIRRRDVVLLGLGAAVAAAAASTIAGPGVAPAEAVPVRDVRRSDFTVLVDGVPVPNVERVTFEPVRTVLNRGFDGAISWGFVEGPVRLRIVVEGPVTGSPLHAWYLAARNDGQPPARRVVVRYGRESGRNPMLVLVLDAAICHLVRVAPIERPIDDQRTLGTPYGFDIDCTVGLGNFSLERVTATPVPPPEFVTAVLVAPAGGTGVHLTRVRSVAGGTALFDTGIIPPYGTDPFEWGEGVSPLVLHRNVSFTAPIAAPLADHIAAILAGTAPGALDLTIQQMFRRKIVRTLRYRNAWLRAYTPPEVGDGYYEEGEPVLERFEFVASSVEIAES